MRVGQAADVEHQVGIHRQAVREAETQNIQRQAGGFVEIDEVPTKARRALGRRWLVSMWWQAAEALERLAPLAIASASVVSPTASGWRRRVSESADQHPRRARRGR